MEEILSPPSSIAVEFKNITKTFGNLVANSEVSFRVRKGTVHAIVGENGAGKSTVVKLLNGFYTVNSGEIFINGEKVKLQDTLDAIQCGVGTVHQHFMLIHAMTVLDNLILGSYPIHTGAIINKKKIREEVEQLAKEYHLEVDLDQPISNLSVGVRQRVEILKAVFRRAEILVLDEPSAVLTALEIAALFQIINKVRDAGKTVILITHKLHEVMQISDYITIMRGGKVVKELLTKQTNVEEIAALMVGGHFQVYTRQPLPKKGVMVEVKNLNYQKKGTLILKDLNFNIRAGEIVGIAGISGNGQIELEEVLTGMIREGVTGEVVFDQKPILKLDPKQIRSLSVAHVPADRIERGYVSNFTNMENAILGYHWKTVFKRWGGFFRFQKIKDYAEQVVKDFDVRPAQIEYLTRQLSGGNQQKMVVGRELNSDPKFLIAAEPTRGVDVGSIELIHKNLLLAREKGVAILLFSSELDEIKKLADRSFVLCSGKIAGEIDWEKHDEKQIGMLMIGQSFTL